MGPFTHLSYSSAEGAAHRAANPPCSRQLVRTQLPETHPGARSSHRMGGPVVATARGSSLQHTHINPVALGHRPLTRRQPRAWCLRPVAAASDPAAWRDTFNRQASDARARLEEWARQQRLNERLRSGMDAARSAASMAGEQASRTARKVRQHFHPPASPRFVCRCSHRVRG
jgi:hypothetical protein